jgi:hypothetical protein
VGSSGLELAQVLRRRRAAVARDPMAAHAACRGPTRGRLGGARAGRRTSRDHDFGLRLTLLVGPEDADPVREFLQEELTESYAGEPVRFATTWDPDPRRHRVDVLTIEALAERLLG